MRYFRYVWCFVVFVCFSFRSHLRAFWKALAKALVKAMLTSPSQDANGFSNTFGTTDLRRFANRPAERDKDYRLNPLIGKCVGFVRMCSLNTFLTLPRSGFVPSKSPLRTLGRMWKQKKTSKSHILWRLFEVCISRTFKIWIIWYTSKIVQKAFYCSFKGVLSKLQTSTSIISMRLSCSQAGKRKTNRWEGGQKNQRVPKSKWKLSTP